MQKKQYNFSKIVTLIAIILLVIVIINFIITFVALSFLSKEGERYAHNVITSSIREVNAVLANVENVMISEIVYDNDLSKLEVEFRKPQEERSLDSQLSIRRIKSLMSAWAVQYEFDTPYVIYFETSGEEIYSSNTNADYDNWRLIGEDIIRIMTGTWEESISTRSWNLVKIKGESYLIKYYNYNQRSICSWINVDQLARTIANDEIADRSYFVFSNLNGEVHNNASQLESDGISLLEHLSVASQSSVLKNQIIVTEPMSNQSFYIHAVIKDYAQIANVLRIQVFLGITLALAVIIYVFFLLYIRRTLISPIQHFTENVSKIKSGDHYTVETHYQINELASAGQLLADLVNQIKGLKIDVYEQSLAQQKIKMDFLTLQIEPHFFLNCLNIIFNMAEMEKYKEIQNLARCVSDYLRYIFKSKENAVLLVEELNHTEKYLEIQKIRYRNGFHCHLSIDSRLEKTSIPPLIIQTFVENALKHTMNSDDMIQVFIHAREETQAGRKYMRLIIEDSGQGFKQEVLEKLQNGLDISEGEKQIGIMNVIQRLQLCYGGQAKIEFYNRPLGGAGVTMLIPLFEVQARMPLLGDL